MRNNFMRFTHIYWLRNKNQGVFLEISTDSSSGVWDRIEYKSGILNPDYYKILTGPDYPGGQINTYREKIFQKVDRRS